jgi:2,4-dienoyl-CoA reductase-like NADH-dependent reductase (Old Yellow Enzyme family)
MTDMFAPLTFAHGAPLPNRLMLAPLTNQQSHPDGTLSDAEHHWLAMRAKGGFGAVMTAAAYVHPAAKGFPGQLGIHDDACLPGLAKLAAAIKAEGSASAVQLYHGGIRADQKASGLQALGPSDDAETGSRAMTILEVESAIDAFISAATRAEKAGFNGVELHGAHNYLICEFLSTAYNRR